MFHKKKRKEKDQIFLHFEREFLAKLNLQHFIEVRILSSSTNYEGYIASKCLDFKFGAIRELITKFRECSCQRIPSKAQFVLLHHFISMFAFGNRLNLWSCCAGEILKIALA
jgi:hypothetical protein